MNAINNASACVAVFWCPHAQKLTVFLTVKLGAAYGHALESNFENF